MIVGLSAPIVSTLTKHNVSPVLKNVMNARILKHVPPAIKDIFSNKANAKNAALIALSV